MLFFFIFAYWSVLCIGELVCLGRNLFPLEAIKIYNVGSAGFLLQNVAVFGNTMKERPCINHNTFSQTVTSSED
jgi:hypothetical protein